jgi:hypothetical protein
MAYDAARNRVVLFGGDDNSPGYLGDTWEWDGSTWVAVASTTSPNARYGHAMVYDESDQRVVLFGGDNNASGLLAETWINRSAASAAGATYGVGCGTPSLALTPDATGRPILGQLATATITNAPTTAGAIAIGFSDQTFGPFALPVALTSIGMPGCNLWQSSEILGLGTSALTAGSLQFALAIPNQSNAVGTHLYLQAYCFAPGANSLQVIASNGIDWLVGNQ